MYRRRFVAGATAGSLGVLAGCLGGLREYEATPVSVSGEALADAGYVHDATRALIVTESIIGQEIRAVNYVSEYHRHLELDLLNAQEAGVFAAISSPRVSILGRDINPIADYDDAEITELIQERYDELSIGSSVGSRAMEVLGSSTEVTTFEGEGRIAGVGLLDLYVDVGQFDSADDHVVVVGLYPRQIPGEDDRVTALIEGLRHDGDDVEGDEEIEE